MSEQVRGLSLTQPWATLVAIGAKKIETRSWATSFRGLVAIHAAKGLGSVGGHTGLIDICLSEPFRSSLAIGGAGLLVPGDDLPLGAIVAVARLVECRTTNPGVLGRPDNAPLAWSREHAFGDYSPGRFMWFLEDVRALPEPIPCRGSLGLWAVPSDVWAKVEGQLLAGSVVR